MKKKEVVELREKSIGELEKVLLKVKEKLAKAVAGTEQGKGKNVRIKARSKDDIARIKTVIRQKQLEGEK